MRVKRNKSLTSKLTHAEFAALEILAGGQPVGAWAREQLLAISARRATEETVIGEIVALRTIVVNLQVANLRREELTTEDIHKLIYRADRDKLEKARARLASKDSGSQS